MNQYGRVVRMENSDINTSPVVNTLPPQKDTSPLGILWSILIGVLAGLWSLIRVIWYWLERIFLVVFLASLAIGLGWWLSQTPSLLRDWEPIDSRLPEISWSGDTMVTVGNIRNNTWKTDIEFSPDYKTETYDINMLSGLSYVITPFSDKDGPAHTMFTFSFADGRTIAISPEIRKERGESFDAVMGVLNQYEIYYLVATEDDVIKLRTNYRKNEVYMYPIKVEKEKIQQLFRSMLIRADKLAKEPEFYNTLWNNCAISLLQHTNALRQDKLKAGIYSLLPAHSDEMIYRAGLINTKLSLPDARAYYRIDELARANTGTTDFSTLIRKPIK